MLNESQQKPKPKRQHSTHKKKTGWNKRFPNRNRKKGGREEKLKQINGKNARNICVPVSPVARAAWSKHWPMALVPTLGPQRWISVCSDPPCPEIEYRIRCLLQAKRAMSRYFTSKRRTRSPRRFRSCLNERGPAPRETAGFTLCTPRRPYPRRNPGSKRPSEFPARRAQPGFPH